jgi:hypothetical protein
MHWTRLVVIVVGAGVASGLSSPAVGFIDATLTPKFGIKVPTVERLPLLLMPPEESIASFGLQRL